MTETKLTNPPPLFKLFGGTEDERREKIMILAKHLKEDYLVMPDELRNYPAIYSILAYYNLPNHLFYEFGDFSGLVGFTEIIEGRKAEVFFKLWDKEIFNKTFVRQLNELLDMGMRELSLKRLNSITADKRIVKLAKMVGFEVEGRRDYDFYFNEKPYSTFLLGRFRTNENLAKGYKANVELDKKTCEDFRHIDSEIK